MTNNYKKQKLMLLKGRNRNTNRRENEGIPAINLTLLEADDSGSL